jgi:pimeloyl-ACP methyl ester carboxylesterase
MPISAWLRSGAVLVFAGSCAHAPASPAEAAGAGWSEAPGLHSVRFVTVDPGVDLEVLDWGGNGPPVVLLAGLSHSAHVFDDFAPALTDRFHVYGITRRGWGRSSVPEKGYGLGTLKVDLLHALDALGLARVSLIGHSAAGDELTAFAVTYPARVERLIYLDAAYDRSDVATRPDALGDCNNVSPPTEADIASASAFGAWFARSRGAALPESEVHMLFEHHGPSEAAAMEYMTSLQHPEYARVSAPALALYAVPESAADFYPGWVAMDEAARAKAQACFEQGKEQVVGKASRADFRAHAPRGQVVEFARREALPLHLQPRRGARRDEDLPRRRSLSGPRR